jgi:two-component system sensor kinase FixL
MTDRKDVGLGSEGLTLKQRRLYAELARTSRVQAMAAMTSTFAHDLNQTFTAAMNFINAGEMLVEASTDLARDDMEKFLQKANQQIERAGEMVQTIQRVAEPDDADCTNEDVNEIVEAAVSLVLALCENGRREVSLDLRDDLPPIAVDRNLLLYVFFVLLENALKATATLQSGQVTIATRGLDEDHLDVAITDNGRGLPSVVSEKLFGGGAATPQAGPGLGLVSSYRAIRAMGGQMSLDNNDKMGTAFHITLPLANIG